VIPASDYTETLIEGSTVYDGGMLAVRRDRVRLPDGGESWREYVLHPGAVMVCAITDDGQVVLERQYRYPPRQHYIELPAGKLEPGEDPLATAQRELIEECGLEAQRWKRLATLHPTIGYSNEVIHLFEARGLADVGRALDEGEFLDVFRLPLVQALELVRSGEICDGKTAFGILWYAQFGR
jgi:ADP-ribose pyrophosphatase